MMPRDPARPNAPLATRLAELDKLTNPMDELVPNFLGLIYGNSGTGKSVLALRLAQKITPPGKEIVFVDSNEGWVSVLNHPIALRNRVRRVEYAGYTQLQTVEEAIRVGAPGWDNVGCIVLDEFTTMVQNDLYQITMNRANTPEGIRDGKDAYAPVWPDMRTSTHKANIIEQALLNLDMHVILVGHERKDKDKYGNVLWTFSLMAESREFIKRPLHLVARCTADIVNSATDAKNLYRRSVQCHPSKLVDAKSRVGGLDISEEFGPFINKVDTWLRAGAEKVDEAAPVITEAEATLMNTLTIDEDD